MRLIDADKIKEMFDSKTWQGEMMIAITDSLPTVEAKEVVHGEWIEYEIPHIICCSECDWGTSVDEKHFNFCPNCGAKMVKEGGVNER